MRVDVSYIGNKISDNVSLDNLFISEDPSSKNLKNHIYVKSYYRPEKTFLIISQALVEYLIQNKHITKLHVQDHFEILYFVIFYKTQLKLIEISFEENKSTMATFFLARKMISEARSFIKSELHNFDCKVFDKTREFKLSIIMTTFNRTQELLESLKALDQQTFKDFELIVINDGSNKEDVLELHKSIKTNFFTRNKNWKWVDQDNTYLGAARNNGAASASGNCFLFLDDDNVPKLNMVESYKFHWETYDYKIFTSCFEIFRQVDESSNVKKWAPFVTPKFSSTLVNNISDAQCLIARDTFYEVGGYTIDKGVGFEDWEFYLKFLAKNIRIFPIAEYLYLYRVHADNSSMRNTTNDFKNSNRALREIYQKIPRLKNAILLNSALHSKLINSFRF